MWDVKLFSLKTALWVKRIHLYGSLSIIAALVASLASETHKLSQFQSCFLGFFVALMVFGTMRLQAETDIMIEHFRRKEK